MSIDESVKVDEKVDDKGESFEIVTKDEVKVALDTDDAPFLEEEPEEEPEEAESLPSADISDDSLEEGQGWSKKKKIVVIGSGVGLLLLIAAAAAWWFLFNDPIVTTPEKIIEPKIIVVPSIVEDQEPPEYYVNLEPFLVELKDKHGNPVFLVFKFSAVTAHESLAREAENKSLVLRDAVYYYLINKTHEYLVDSENVDIIKSDLSSVLSGYLAGGKIDGVLFESYLTK